MEDFSYNELDQNRTDIYFRDKEILYLIKLLILIAFTPKVLDK